MRMSNNRREEEADEIEGEEEGEEERPRQLSKSTRDGSETEDEETSFWPKLLVNTEILLHSQCLYRKFLP
jgi:hypothetical protein